MKPLAAAVTQRPPCVGGAQHEREMDRDRGLQRHSGKRRWCWKASTRLRGAGFDDRGIHDICAVTAYFAFVNRIADGLGVELETT